MIDIKFEFPDWAGAMKRNERRLNLFLAAQIQANRGMLFDSEGQRNRGGRWPTLKFRNGMILSDRGALRKSIAPYNPRGRAGPSGIVKFTEDVIVVGTSMLYARMMNDGTTKMPGGVLRPKNAKALKIPLPKGENATQTAKNLRAAPLQDRVEKAQERLERARKRYVAASTFSHEAKTEQALMKAMRAQKSFERAREQVGNALTRRQRTRSTGKGGRNFIFVQSVKIPARPFDEWTSADQMEIDNALKLEIIGILNESTH